MGPVEEFKQLWGTDETPEEIARMTPFRDNYNIRCIVGANVLMNHRLSYPLYRNDPKFKDWIWGDLRRSIYDSMGIIMNHNDDRKITNG